jgi:membrane dipeptidase
VSWPRRGFLAGAAGSALVGPLPAEGEDRDLAAGREFLAAHLTIDPHSHLGRFYNYDPLTAAELAEASAAGVDVLCLAAVGDKATLLRRHDGEIKALRLPESGELARDVAVQLAPVRTAAAEGRLVLVGTAAELDAPAAVPKALLAVEGADFLEGGADGLPAAHEAGIRVVTLVHLRVNELGDVQTEAEQHGGLTEAGAAIVAGMNRVGMVVDVAHAAYATARAAVLASTAPVLLSHANLDDGSGHPRNVPSRLPRLIADRGGVTCAWPLDSRGKGLDGVAAAVRRLVDVAGVEHCGLATDIGGLCCGTPVADYAGYARLVGRLLVSGMPAGTMAALTGGNVRRLLVEAMG